MSATRTELRAAADAVGALNKSLRGVFLVAETMGKVADLMQLESEVEDRVKTLRATESVLATSIDEADAKLKSINEAAAEATAEATRGVEKIITSTNERVDVMLKAALENIAAEQSAVAAALDDARAEEATALKNRDLALYAQESAEAKLRELNKEISAVQRKVAGLGT